MTVVGNGTQVGGTVKSSGFLRSPKWALEPTKLRKAAMTMLKKAFEMPSLRAILGNQ